VQSFSRPPLRRAVFSVKVELQMVCFVGDQVRDFFRARPGNSPTTILEARMRIAAITTLGFILASGSAWAQSSYDYRDRDRDSDRSGAYSGSGSDAYGASRSGSRSSSSRYDADDDSSKYDRWSDNGYRHSMGKSSRGASFYLKSGDREFRVECGDDSAKECVDAALQLFRQTQDAARTTTGATGSPTTSPTPTTPGGSVSPGTGTGTTSP
jgi:hypothetical protein